MRFCDGSFARTEHIAIIYERCVVGFKCSILAYIFLSSFKNKKLSGSFPSFNFLRFEMYNLRDDSLIGGSLLSNMSFKKVIYIYLL